MPITMGARREISEELRSKYGKAKKKQKGAILDQVTELTGWCRKHAAAVLSGFAPIAAKGKSRKKHARRDRRGRKPRYSLKHKEILKKVWAVLDFSSSVRVKAGMKDVLDSMIRNAHIVLEGTLYEDMCVISAPTINRMLKYDREAMSPRGRALTKPGSLLKSQIPIRRGSDWSENEAGFVEIDCVAHCGSSGTGEFISTLDMTDVKSGWTGLRAMRNKARVHAVAAIEYLSFTFPFTIKGIDSDNGSEFINDHLLAYCKQKDLVFTRGRPETKNDGCFVEQKNWSVARRFAGYYRFEGQETVDIMNGMYGLLSLYINYFMPSQKLMTKTRDGARISRKHDAGLTPYRRIMGEEDISADIKSRLTETFENLDVWELRLKIRELQDILRRGAVPSK
jgi:hypothetical protein